MGNFVKLNTALPTPKVDANPPRGLPNELDAADINNLWNALADLRAGLIGPDAIYKLVATGAISRSLFAKLADLISINDFGIGDPSAVLNVLENGRVSQLPWIDPFAWWRMDTGMAGALPVAALLGEKQEVSAIARASTGTVVVGGVETTAAANQLRFQDNPPGLLLEATRTQFISVPDAPVSQAGLALGVASYNLRVEGTGSIAVALATGTATGLPGTATAGAPLSFAITATATVNTTVTGTVTFAQLENGKFPTSKIHTAITRQADWVSMPSVLRNGRDWLVTIRAQPSGGINWSLGDDRSLLTIGDAFAVANSALSWIGGVDGQLRLIVYDSTGTSKTVSTDALFLGNVEHEFWFYGSTDGKMEAWIDGQMSNAPVSGTGTGIITTMPPNLRPGDAHPNGMLNGVVKDFRIYYDTTPDRLPKPQWTRVITPATVVCLGDSITFGFGLSGNPYPTTLQTTLSSGSTGAWTVLNAGVTGDRTVHTVRRWGAGVRRQTQKYVVLLSGTNDLANSLQSPTVWANLTRIATQVRVDGKSLVLVTILPRTGLSVAQNAERVKVNVLIRAYCAAGGAILVDADPSFDNGDGITMKVSLAQGDGIHPNQAGADLLAAMVAAAIPH